MERGVQFYCRSFRKKRRGATIFKPVYQRIEELKTSLGDRYQDQTISITSGSSSSLVAFTKSTFSVSILSDLGLRQLGAQNVITLNGAIYNISEERWKQVDGDVLFFLAFGEEGRAAFESLQQRPLWRKLKAVQRRQVYLVNGYTWTGSNLLAADAVIDDLYKYLVNSLFVCQSYHRSSTERLTDRPAEEL